MPNLNILKLNDILREKNDNVVPARGKIKSIQISDKIVEGLKSKNISSSTIEKLSRMQGTIVSDRREVHHKIDGYDFYITDYRGKRGHYETVKVSYRTEKVITHQNELKTAQKTVEKTKPISSVKKPVVSKIPVFETIKTDPQNVDFKKTIVKAKSTKIVKKVNRDKLLNEELKVVDFNKMKQEKQNATPSKKVQVKKTNTQSKTKKPSLSASKTAKKSNTIKSNSTLKVNKKPSYSNFKDNNIATKQNIKNSSLISKKPKSIGKNSNTLQWYSSSQTTIKSNFWDKLVYATKTVINCFNVTRWGKKGW